MLDKPAKPKEIYSRILAVLTKDRRENGITKKEQAESLGNTESVLFQKLKSGDTDRDIGLSQVIEIMDMTGNLEILDALNTRYGRSCIDNSEVKPQKVRGKYLHEALDSMVIEVNRLYYSCKTALMNRETSMDAHEEIIRQGIKAHAALSRITKTAEKKMKTRIVKERGLWSRILSA